MARQDAAAQHPACAACRSAWQYPHTRTSTHTQHLPPHPHPPAALSTPRTQAHYATEIAQQTLASLVALPLGRAGEGSPHAGTKRKHSNSYALEACEEPPAKRPETAAEAAAAAAAAAAQRGVAAATALVQALAQWRPEAAAGAGEADEQPVSASAAPSAGGASAQGTAQQEHSSVANGIHMKAPPAVVATTPQSTADRAAQHSMESTDAEPAAALAPTAQPAAGEATVPTSTAAAAAGGMPAQAMAVGEASGPANPTEEVKLHFPPELFLATRRHMARAGYPLYGMGPEEPAAGRGTWRAGQAVPEQYGTGVAAEQQQSQQEQQQRYYHHRQQRQPEEEEGAEGVAQAGAGGSAAPAEYSAWAGENRMVGRLPEGWATTAGPPEQGGCEGWWVLNCKLVGGWVGWLGQRDAAEC